MRIVPALFAIPFAALIAFAGCGGGVTSNSDCAPVPLHCFSGCGGISSPSCVNGQWVCPEEANCTDASASDAATDASVDASHDAVADAPADTAIAFDAASVACGPMLSCANASQYCQEASGGPPPPPDAGNGVGYSCVTYPTACTNDRTCACLRANGACSGALADCEATGAGLTVSCAFP